MITLISGRSVDESQIHFDETSSHFTLGDVDITNDIFRRDKLNVPGFDITKDNERLFREKYAANNGGQQAPIVGSTSTLDNFVTQIETDPLGAPLEVVDKAVANIVKSSGVRTLVVGAVLVLVIVIYLKK